MYSNTEQPICQMFTTIRFKKQLNLKRGDERKFDLICNNTYSNNVAYDITYK